MTGELYQFVPFESPQLDTTRIMVLRQALGDQRCREVVEEVVFHLTDRLSLLQAALSEGDTAQAHQLASRMSSLSEQVGLADFARVSRDLCGCLASRDVAAIGAVGTRLMRLGEESLFSVILYADQCAL